MQWRIIPSGVHYSPPNLCQATDRLFTVYLHFRFLIYRESWAELVVSCASVNSMNALLS